MFNVGYMNDTALRFLDEVELKDQQAKNETVDQQVQAGESAPARCACTLLWNCCLL